MPQPIDMKRYAQLKAAGDLPSPRGVALAIIQLTQTPDVSLAQLGRVIKGDPAFVGRLIKAANGLVAESRRAIVSVQEALMVLGLPAVRTLALGFSLLSAYRKGACQGFDYPCFWSSALLMANAMQALSQRVRVVAPDEAFSLGLLARVGELSLATLYPEAFSRLLAELERNPALEQVVLEDQAFAMNHRELGAAMLADWGVPDALVQAVRFHEQPELAGYGEDSREAGIVQCLVLARAIAQLCLAPESEHVRLMTPMLRLSGRLGLGGEAFVSLCERVGRDWREWGGLLQIRTEDTPRFAEVGSAVAEESGGAVKEIARFDDLKPMWALIAAGARDERELLREEFEAAGLVVFYAAGADAALEAVLDIQPQLVLADWSKEGERVVRCVRDMRLGRGVYVICLLEDVGEASVLAALGAGADDFLVRPLQRAALTMRVRACLRMLVLRQELERECEELRNFVAELSISNRRLQEVVRESTSQPAAESRGACPLR